MGRNNKEDKEKVGERKVGIREGKRKTFDIGGGKYVLVKVFVHCITVTHHMGEKL